MTKVKDGPIVGHFADVLKELDRMPLNRSSASSLEFKQLMDAIGRVSAPFISFIYRYFPDCPEKISAVNHILSAVRCLEACQPYFNNEKQGEK